MPTINDYQRQHIILLIGENPLPNYVAAKLLLLPEGTAHLMCSTATQPIADRLGEMLESEGFQSQRIQILDEESDGFTIASELGRHLKAISDDLHLPIPDLSIGINYTGGTKVMAIHAYKTLLENNPTAVFSYLNPRRLELCIDDPSNQSTRRIGVSTKVKPTLEQLLELHNLKLFSSGVSNKKLINLASEFAQYVSDLQLAQNQNFKAKNAWNSWHTSDGRETQELCQSLDVSLEDFRQWQDRGDWLEHYVFEQINQLAQQFQLHDIATSVRVQDPQKKMREPDKERFEFDVGFLRGYQLFGISCTTTAKRSTCKLKLIEADLRAKQLGGSEARVALICCYEDSEDLKEEVRLMGLDPKVEVFDRTEIDPETLSEKLAVWIERNIEN